MLRGYQAWMKLNGMLLIQPAYDRGERRMDVVKTDTGTRPGNLLARTAADGGWVFLAADSAHDWCLLTGEAGTGHHSQRGCIHEDPVKAQENIERIKALAGYPRVKIEF
ncbi:hypothetical protein LXA43DRAFT_1155536 [Ganoderma leucocontextum]|nr:hypothetical protein LXA43DRAFT_1155536 [Ganoderma leucocontextum]